MEPGTCLEQVPIVTAVAAWGLAIELVIWTLPIPASWKLQMPRSNKVALTCIFGLGIFDIGVGVGRMITILQVDPQDFTWTQVPALQWLAIEPSIAIIVACLCVCRPLLEKILPKRCRPLASGRPGEDHIKLVSSKSGIHQYSPGVSGDSDIIVSRTEAEETPKCAIQVRKDYLVVSADNKV
ncbi:MAG: hypothetical protein L6R38_008621 [Xanthoria sp. 2 TBL-2021]|nr:MAG: hypothetical protein L6R38_008621 [Xanthoria sp. 2 TBL-2021]